MDIQDRFSIFQDIPGKLIKFDLTFIEQLSITNFISCYSLHNVTIKRKITKRFVEVCLITRFNAILIKRIRR